MKTIFKVGDKVFDIFYGWGEVIEIIVAKEEDNTYLIEVMFPDQTCTDIYTKDGKWDEYDKLPRLSFTEYSIVGMSQERPENLKNKI